MAERHSQAVLARFRAPRYVQLASDEPLPAVGVDGNRTAGGVVEIHLRRNPDATLTARFRAYGDPATIAAADWLCEQLDGQGVDVAHPRGPDIEKALALPGRNAHSAAVAARALERALANL